MVSRNIPHRCILTLSVTHYYYRLCKLLSKITYSCISNYVFNAVRWHVNSIYCKLYIKVYTQVHQYPLSGLHAHGYYLGIIMELGDCTMLLNCYWAFCSWSLRHHSNKWSIELYIIIILIYLTYELNTPRLSMPPKHKICSIGINHAFCTISNCNCIWNSEHQFHFLFWDI